MGCSSREASSVPSSHMVAHNSVILVPRCMWYTDIQANHSHINQTKSLKKKKSCLGSPQSDGQAGKGWVVLDQLGTVPLYCKERLRFLFDVVVCAHEPSIWEKQLKFKHLSRQL